MIQSREEMMASITKRKGRGGKDVYRVLIRLKGSPTQSATFERLTDAKKWAQDTESAIRDGRYFRTSQSKKHSVEELINRYIRDMLPQKKDGKHQEMQLKWWKNEVGALTLADLTPPVIAEFRDKLAEEGRKPATVVRYLAVLSHCCTIAVKEYGWLESNPVLRVSKPKEPRGRIRFLTEDERIKLLEACKESWNPDLYLAVVFALQTGMRQAEQMNLRWDQINLGKGTIILHDTKNNERRVVALTGEAYSLLNDRSKIRRLDTDLVFPGKNPQRPPDLRKPWEAALKEAKIENFRWHDLRHTFASYLAMSGATLPEIAAALGHKTLNMVQRYAHLSEAHTASVVERMNKIVFGSS